MIDVLLLLGLPASGKSEVRRFLANVPPPLRLADFGLGRLVQIDDFPYVWVMRAVDAFRRSWGLPPAYFLGPDLPFRDAREWLALSLLLRWDFADIERGTLPRPWSAGTWLLDRIERARRTIGLPPAFRAGERKARAELDDTLAVEAAALLDERRPHLTADGPQTYLVELARGAADWMRPPLPAPLGYEASLPFLGQEILGRAAVLHVHVSPEESLRRNLQRADPSHPGSVLGHSVPEIVMRQDYGIDDLGWLAARSDVPGTIRIPCGDRWLHLPIVAFENEPDLTSFARQATNVWPRSKVEELYDELSDVLGRLASTGVARAMQHELGR
jgi:hypothetical protein